MNNMQHALSFRPLRSSDGLRCRPVQALGAIFLGLASLAYSVTSQAADEPENVKVVRLADLARIELGAQDYGINAALSGKPMIGLVESATVYIDIQPSPTRCCQSLPMMPFRAGTVPVESAA